jgi:hypothetical protein
MPSPDPGGGSPGAVAYGDPDDGGGPALARGAALPGRDPGDGSPGVVANGDPDDGGQLPAVSDGDIRIGS